MMKLSVSAKNAIYRAFYYNVIFIDTNGNYDAYN